MTAMSVGSTDPPIIIEGSLPADGGVVPGAGHEASSAGPYRGVGGSK